MKADIKPDFFHAVVSSNDPGTFVVQVDPIGSDTNAPIVQGVSLASAFALALGFRETLPLPVGVKVLCLSITPTFCYILGVVPDQDSFKVFPTRTSLKTAGDGIGEAQNRVGYNGASKQFTHNNNRPTDIVSGELGWINDFGVMLGAFQQVALLKGSELAQVQAFLLDDLVRIVSHNFEHFSAIGEFKIYHDGKALLAEFGGTHLGQEALGTPQPSDNTPTPVFEDVKEGSVDDSKDFYEQKDPDVRKKGIERLKMYFGRLADFVQLYVVRPTEGTQRDLSGGVEDPDRGLMRCHVGLDGSVHFSTVSEFFIEKVNWIRVPERVRAPDDPEGDDAELLDYDEKKLYEFNDTYKYRDNPYLYFLQLRNYSAYLNKFQYQNFDKHEKDFKTAKSPEDETTQLENIDKVDKWTPTHLPKFKLRTSGIYLLPNGGVMAKNAWGSGFIMDGPDICIQPARDLILQPMRNLVAKVGQFVSVAAKKDIDFSTTEEGIRFKSAKCQYFLSDEQGIVLESKATRDSSGEPTDDAVETLGGIVLKSSKGIYSFSETKFDRVKESYIIKSNNYYAGISRDMWLFADGTTYLASDAGLNLLSSDGTINALAGNSFIAGGSSNTVLGQKGNQLGVVPKGMFANPIEGALEIGDILDGYNSILDIDIQSFAKAFRDDSDFENLKFRFLSSEKYNFKDNQEGIPQTLAQQENDITGEFGLGTWTEIPVNDTLPFPGKEKFETFFFTGELNNVTNKDGELVSKKIDELSEKNPSITLGSLNDYKVIP